MNGLPSLPRYSYDPVTQTYRLLTPTEIAAKQQQESGSGGTAGPPPSGSPSGFGAMVDIGNSLYSLSQAVPGVVTGVLGSIGQGMVSHGLSPAIDAWSDEALAVAQSAAQANAALAAANQAQAQSQSQAASPADAAVTAADIAAAADALGIAPGVGPGVAGPGADGPGADGAGGGGGGGGGGGADGGGGASGAASGDPGGGASSGQGLAMGGSVMGMGDSAPRYAYAPIMMAEGGLAAAARHLQNTGRGNDTMLVHMTPGEVKGLQALAMSQGGSLTINPTTGLPEAGFLSAILPMVAGAFLGPAGIGLTSSALGTAALVGGLTGVATGSLKKGLMAGLGAYGGYGLGQGLVSAATPATDIATRAPNLISAGDMAVSTVTPEAAQALSYGDKIGLGMQSPYFQAAQSNIDPGLLQGMTAEQVVNAPVLSATPGVMPPPTTAPTGFGAAKSGFENIFKTGPEGATARAAFGKALPFGTTMAIGAPLASAAAEPPKGPGVTPAYIRPYTFAWNPNTQAYEPSPQPGDTSERRYFNPTFTPLPIYQAAEGGQIDSDYNMDTNQNSAFSDGYAEGGSTGLGALAKRRRSLMGDKLYKFADSRRDQSMEAAIEQNFAAGGLPPRFLSGGGDGMSDSIKANIDGKQEARLADGEFVVPADVVSHLGNGSSKAGAKKLYAMMDKIRKARTGSKRQAPEVNAAKYMPA